MEEKGYVSVLDYKAFKDGQPIGDRANSIWLYIVPSGMRSLMQYIKEKYGNPLVYITENGMDDPNSIFIPIQDAFKDEKRIKYHNDYLTNLLAANVEDGSNVKGYFAWSLLDNWEWVASYTSRFGLYFVSIMTISRDIPRTLFHGSRIS
ncbi:Glycoside hydrolase, family 1 [Corchorus olitorius]|uniref:Glycoside hydrolase, family 1 n=1 Tax=Corchorus olitorius TaxID=93759 RepID=A0A1R3H0F4_9ROSI|nr:Glycoside hydrolase, family 1 [Corchorus olitorius]